MILRRFATNRKVLTMKVICNKCKRVMDVSGIPNYTMDEREICKCGDCQIEVTIIHKKG